MPISNRFTEYGVTGSFFWISQIVLFWSTGYDWTEPFQELELFLSPMPNALELIITGLASALAVVAVFIAGLLLDLLAVYFVQLEMGVFRRHLDRNHNWLVPLIEAHEAYCGDDYEEFGKMLPFNFRTLLFGIRGQRLKNPFRQWKLVRPYERLWSFFYSYVLVVSGAAQLTLMINPYYLWRTSRAISTVLVIIALEAPIILINVEQSSFTLLWIFQIAAYLILLGGAFLITLGTYSRLCFIIFSLVYVTHNMQAAQNKSVQPS